MRRRPNAFILLLLLLLGLYWGYQHYQTKQYSAAILPAYQTLNALQENLEAIYDLGDSDEQLLPGQIAECERIQNTLIQQSDQLVLVNRVHAGFNIDALVSVGCTGAVGAEHADNPSEVLLKLSAGARKTEALIHPSICSTQTPAAKYRHSVRSSYSTAYPERCTVW